MQLKIIVIFYFILLTNNAFAKPINYYMSLKNDNTNVRQGPSFEYPIKFIYKKNTYQLKLLIDLKILENLETYIIILDGYIFHNFLKKKQL